jgi:3-deoxy-D-manno-octulosonic acid kinase
LGSGKDIEAGKPMNLKKTTYNRYEIYTVEDTSLSFADPSALIDRFRNAPSLENKGRGGVTLLDINGGYIACRKYIHGGLFRAITGDIFFSAKRAIEELKILLYLKEREFPVVQPYGLIVRENFVTKSPYILTVFEENAADLTEVLNTSTRKQRLRIIKILAQLMWRMETLGVYHPDLHLDNVLVTAEGTLKFLDFDRAQRKSISKTDMERMFWRLNRYAEKMERQGKLNVDVKEKLLFLRTYGKLSGFDMAGEMEKKIGLKRIFSQTGWFFESLLYGRKGSGVKQSNIKN